MEPAQLIIMRHATAGLGGGRDHERPLTGEGHDEARRVGERLRLIGPIPTQIVSSSARRCRETWAAVSAGLGASPDLEIEDALYPHPAVLECAVIGVPHEKWGETPKALVVAREGQSPSEEELIAFCREQLAHFKCPTSIELVPELPRTATGKLQKFKLREQYWQGERRVNG